MEESLKSGSHHKHHHFRSAFCETKSTFFTIGEAPTSGIKSTVDRNSSRPRRRFSKKVDLNFAGRLVED